MEVNCTEPSPSVRVPCPILVRLVNIKAGTQLNHLFDQPAPSLVFLLRVSSANTKGGSVTVPLTSCLTGLKPAV
jgi:hypothetical protein